MSIIEWLLTPDDFAGRPWGYLANQCGHIVIGAGLTWLFGAVVARGACFSWEVVHLRRGGSLSDGIEDFGFVAAGVFALMSPSDAPLVLTLAALFMASGFVKRALR